MKKPPMPTMNRAMPIQIDPPRKRMSRTARRMSTARNSDRQIDVHVFFSAESEVGRGDTVLSRRIEVGACPRSEIDPLSSQSEGDDGRGESRRILPQHRDTLQELG